MTPAVVPGLGTVRPTPGTQQRGCRFAGEGLCLLLAGLGSGRPDRKWALGSQVQEGQSWETLRDTPRKVLE